MTYLRIRPHKGLSLLLVAAMAVALLLAAASPAAAATCPIERDGHRGYYLCQYSPTTVTWDDGHQQIFVVGTDRQVWTIYQTEWRNGLDNWSWWQPLGGEAWSRVYVDYVFADAAIQIRVYGSGVGWWCTDWNKYRGRWRGYWFRCTP